jgi:hypothetical protein
MTILFRNHIKKTAAKQHATDKFDSVDDNPILRRIPDQERFQPLPVVVCYQL